MSSRLKRFYAGDVKQGANDHTVIGHRNDNAGPEQESHFRVADFVFLPVGKPYLKWLERLPLQQLSHRFVSHIVFAFQQGREKHATIELYQHRWRFRGPLESSNVGWFYYSPSAI